jgi:hypothetical protein
MMLWGERTVKRQRLSVLERAGRGGTLVGLARSAARARVCHEPRF